MAIMTEFKEVPTVFYPKQCEEYYKAVADEDWYAANLWYLPPMQRRWEDIQSDIKLQEIVMSYEAEKKRIEETPNDILRLEIESKFPKKCKVEKKRGFMSWLFGN